MNFQEKSKKEKTKFFIMMNMDDVVLKKLIYFHIIINKKQRLSCCINAFIFSVHYLCLIGWVYVFYVGHVDRVVYMKPISTVIL
jgi:hypothetical protein